jgi:ribosomal protein S18 acetylase RimI-like enzyme
VSEALAEVAVRSATAADLEAVVEFNIRLARETEDVTLDRALVTAGVTAGMADPAKARYFVAERNGEVIGQLMVTTEWSDWRNGWIWWVQSVYVRSDARKQGVLAALVRRVRELARAEGVPRVRLYVEEHNAAAQAAYRRLGLAYADYHVYEMTP